MEKRIDIWSTGNQAEKEKSSSSNDESGSNTNDSKNPQKKKEVNSWDCSTPTDKGKTSKKKTNDWDSSSEYQETMVEPFNDNENPKDSWDSESEKNEQKDNVTEGKEVPLFLVNSLDSYDLSNADLSDVEKSSLVNLSGESEGEKNSEKRHKEDFLFVEDFEEYLRDDGNQRTINMEELPQSPVTSDSGTEREKVRSNQSEGTPEDTTIWMIPKSERTQSGESTSKLISSSDRQEIEKLKKFSNFLKKTKSLSDVQKNYIRRRTERSSRSEYLGSQKINYNHFLLCEGSDLQRKLEIESKNTQGNISGCENFDRTRVFFTEYECRAMTMEKGTPEKLSATARSSFISTEEVPPENIDAVSNENPPQSFVERSPNETSEVPTNEMVQAGPSAAVSLDVVSLPDMTGRNSIKERQKEKNLNLLNLEVKNSETPKSKTESAVETQISESWLLLDDTGQYQTVTRNEVSILLNGRSADAVLQGRKEHFIPNSTLKNTTSLKNSLSGMLTKESLQHVLKEEDVGGEDERKKLIDLERKVENTLFYIQPGMNLTASVRIIPVDTEMIHIWKTARDGGSLLSSEIDLLDSPQDLIETVSQRNSPDHRSSISRHFVDQTVAEENENQSTPSPMVHGPADVVFPEFHQTQASDYSRLLIETRMIVDSLTNNFRNLQNRLDGESNRNVALQGEVNKLRLLVKTYGGKYLDRNSRETIFEAQTFQSSLTTSPSLLTVKALDKTDIRSESIIEEESEETPTKFDFEAQDENTGMECTTNQNTNEQNEVVIGEENDIITVNIYTVESTTPIPTCGKSQETYSLVQSNLRLIEKKMKRLKQENEIVTRQNVELKRKLREISMELEKYLTSTLEQDTCTEEGKESETLRDQVCNLKLELENLKMLARSQENQLTEENYLIREELTKSLHTLEDWYMVASEVFKKIETTTARLQEIGITVDMNLEPELTHDPKYFSNFLICYVEQTSRCLFAIKDENFLYEQTLKDLQKESNTPKEISGLDHVISGYSELIEQCRKGKITSETKNRVVEDYFAVIVEKASLMEEIKILKTENEMLLESQLQHYEKLKQTLIALKDRKSEIIALESSQKLSEEERSKMTEVLKIYEEEKKKMEVEILEKNRTIENLIGENKRKELEIGDCDERLKAAVNEINNFEKSCRSKDELINELKIENEQLLTAEGIKNNQIEILKNEIKNLQAQGTQLETELTSAKLFLKESQREMTNYITHLEALVNNSEESLEKTKQKLKENNQTICRLKQENDVLDKQRQCDMKLFNNTKDELDAYEEKFIKASNKLKETEELREKLQKKCESLVYSEKQKSEALELLTKEYKKILEENTLLNEKIEIFSKDKDELLKEQKDLINKYAMLSREIQKLQEKYRSVKTECNERTDLIKYLEMMLKENLLEYNNRIACLEQNISRLIEKIVACKNGMKEKHSGDDSEVKELRRQLSVTYQERKELENVLNNYYSLMKHLKNEIQEREKKVDELHVQLTLEQQKAVENENGRKAFHIVEAPKSTENLKIEQLESQIAITDSELAECKKELQLCHTNYENEKKKAELTIADLKSEIKRYQLRLEVMMRNLSNTNKNTNCPSTDKRSVGDVDIQAMKKELQEKNKIIAELNDTIIRYRDDLKVKDSELEHSKKNSFYQGEELKNLQNQIAQLQDAMSTINKTDETQQKERDEMAKKLFQSIKLIMEERSARQANESLALEKEKNYKNQIDQIKNELVLKIKECEIMSRALDDKKKLVNRLQDDLKKMRVELASLRGQMSSYKKLNCNYMNGDGKKDEDHLTHASASLTHVKSQNISPERLESCLRELKETRDLNLKLRKTEGQYQAKIIRLEDEIRDARFLIKELQGDIKMEKKSKKAFKNMILKAKMEVEKCLMAKQLMSVVAERITRHLDLSKVPSRELLSGFRLNDSNFSETIS